MVCNCLSFKTDLLTAITAMHNLEFPDGIPYPLIVHFGIRPPQLSYAGNAEYQKAWRKYVKYRHLLSNMAKPNSDEKMELSNKERRLQKMRTDTKMKRDVTVEVSSKGFRATGIFCDMVQVN
jgi:ribonuclease-3